MNHQIFSKHKGNGMHVSARFVGFLSLLLFLSNTEWALAQKKNLTLDAIFNSSTFVSKTVRGAHWMKDGRHYSSYENDTITKGVSLYLYGAKDKTKRLVLNTASLKISPTDPPFRFTTYEWSPDEKQIMFISAPPDREYLSRLTPAGNVFLYDLDSRLFRRITSTTEPQYNVKFSPDGKSIGLVRSNNIFLIDLNSGSERQLTADGTEHIINGKFDWVYEEEFGISDGWKWSPNGEHIAFWRLDENRVPEYTMTEWDSLHLKLIPMRYPKPGDANSIVKIGVIDIHANSTRWMDLGANDDMYVPRIQWTTEVNTLSIQRLNRSQNCVELLYGDANTGKTRTIITERDSAWVEINDDLTFLNNGTFLWPSERDGYKHLYRYRNDGTVMNQVTKGAWEVEVSYGVDEQAGFLYYNSTEASPLERQVYKVRLDGKKESRLTAKAGTHAASFSPTHEYFLDTFSDATTPASVAVMDHDGDLISTVIENDVPALQDYNLAKTTFFTFTTSDGIVLNASLMKPADYDSSKKYPVLVFTYGGPGSQIVRDQWGRITDELWYSYLTEKGYLIFKVDNRGTGGRGRDFARLGNRKLGTWEVVDHIEAAKYLAGLSFVDKDRIGIWGWSYGGYTSSMVILNAADYYKAAVAVAPVTNWKYYDDIYTERYMGTPQENPDGYKAGSPITFASKLKGKFLIIHGTSDDNVHFQNTANFVAALERANKQFQTRFYPDKNHGIIGGTTRLNVYTLITNFLLENL